MKKNIIPIIVAAISCFCFGGEKENSLYPANAKLKTADGPLVQAHRIALCEYDDNAAGGVKWCLDRGIRGFEIDVRFTKDHRLILMHDDTVNRTTTGSGKTEGLTLAEIRNFKLKKSKELVPTAEEVFLNFQKRKDIFIEIEMKAYPGKNYPPEILEKYCRELNLLAKRTLAPGTYAFTCFNTKTLAMMRKVDASAPIGLIIGGALTDKHLEMAKSLKCCGVASSGKATPKEMIDKAHAEGLAVCLWPAPTKKDWEALKEKGADRVTSDYAAALVEAIGK